MKTAKIIPIYTEEELRRMFEDDNPARAQAGDCLMIHNRITLTSDLVVDVPVTIKMSAELVGLNTNGYELIAKRRNQTWPDNQQIRFI